MVDLKESYEEKMDSTFEMYKEALKEHAYQCALERLEDDFIPIEEYNEEQERVKVYIHHCSSVINPQLFSV